jgi:hypothetical protein
MAHWVFICPHCKIEFNYTEVVIDREYAIEIKPIFPNGRLTIECSNCHTSSVFMQRQLVYRAA